jgi:hypothetical protein
MDFEVVQDNPKLPGDSEEVPISEWNGWRYDSSYEVFSLLDGKETSLVCRMPRTHRPQGRQQTPTLNQEDF